MSSLQKSNTIADLVSRLPFLEGLQLEGKLVFVRADLNVPRDSYGDLIDDGRLKAALPTINYLLDRGARVVVGSHFRRPEHMDESLSFVQMARRLRRVWGVDLKFCPEVAGHVSQKMVDELKAGDLLLLENLRFHPGEIACDEQFAKRLLHGADVYVNDAFGVCHRPHASLVLLPKMAKESVCGFQVKRELMALQRALNDPARPLAAIIGGQSVEENLPVLLRFLELADYLLLGGRLGDSFARLMFGGDLEPLGLTEETVEEIRRILKANQNREYKAKLYMPVDSVLAPQERGIINLPSQNLGALPSKDIGPATRILYREVLSRSNTIIWHGLMGQFEDPAFARGTSFVVKAISESQGVTLAGGVETSAALLKMDSGANISFLSTGGVAFLEVLAGRELVALEALANLK